MQRNHGFTLIELLVTVAVTAVLVTVAVPGFRTMMQNNRQVAAANTLLTALNLARSEAVKRGVPVSVCSGTATATTVTCGTSWTNGWVVYYTDTGNNNHPLRAFAALDANLTLKSGTVGANVSFQPNGLSSGSGTFTLCDSRGASDARSVNLSLSGRAVAGQMPGYDYDGTTALTCP